MKSQTYFYSGKEKRALEFGVAFVVRMGVIRSVLENFRFV